VRITTIATTWAYVNLTVKRDEYVRNVERRSAARFARSVSVSFTQHIGDGPYNAWTTQSLADEWHMIGSAPGGHVAT